MAYTSIYRKYRPDTFGDVIGQEHIVRTLKNQIESGTIGHAYIFTGTRGTGKTSVAKIFARAVNCLNPIDGSPCGKCNNCVELARGGNFDIIEMDAASNNSVDQIRELTDKVNFPPTIGKYKVYIIDEVHMLSKSAFNALLKTLEEPPSHVIFILATTEIHQIPATILSRCLRFDFRLVGNSKISERIKFIFNEMNVLAEPSAIDLIASSGGGSVRDALSIADMCVSYCAGDITYSGVLEVLGASDPSKLIEISSAIADCDIDKALHCTAEMAELGKSIPILAADIAALFRNLLYIKNCSSAKNILALPKELFEKYGVLASRYSTEKCLYIMKLMSGLEGDFRYSSQHRIIFEAAVVLAASSEGDDSDKVRELSSKVSALERKLTALQKTGVQNVAPPQPAAPVKRDAKQIWRAVATELAARKQQFLAYAALEAEAEIVGSDFVVKISERATMTLLTDKKNRDIINEVFAAECDMHLTFEETKKLDDDKALPFIKDMFGASLEIK